MPTYEYTCLKCGHQFDLCQSITESPIVTCPKELCAQKRWGKGKVRRGIGGGAGLIFKGSGFYITDYRSEKYKEAAKKDVPPSPSPASEAKSGTDPKTAPAKTDSKQAKTSSTPGTS